MATIGVVARSDLGGVLAAAREAASSSTDQGDRFERLIAAAFEASEVMGFDKVWLWSEWPGADGPDIGVDLVGRLGDSGDLVAIQCKFWQGEISTEAVDSFLAASGRSEFAARMIVHTGTSIQRHGLTKVRNAHPPCGVMGRRQLAELNLDWWALAEEAHAVAPGTPRRRTGTGVGGAWSGLKGSFTALMSSYYSSVGHRWTAWRALLRAWLVVETALVSLAAAAVVVAGLVLVLVAVVAVAAFVIVSILGSAPTKRRRRRSLVGTVAMTALVTSYTRGRRRRRRW